MGEGPALRNSGDFATFGKSGNPENLPVREILKLQEAPEEKVERVESEGLSLQRI
ncbi:MAG: hypothetical protein K5657_07840 [Desulfovibrio sp.]|nr:hypothetical protein [Desulfovibrio sp.]